MRALVACAALIATAACVPADEAGGLGSVQFSFGATEKTEGGISDEETSDGWSLHFDRVVLGFKTMTIGKIGVSDICAYRGRGATSDVVFDPRIGIVQSFNGIQPAECPDVGIIFGPPGPETTLAGGATSKDLVDLATGVPAHAIVDVTAERRPVSASSAPRTLHIHLRFDSTRTATRFGGCRAATRGVTIFPGERDRATVRFAAEHLFRDAISPDAALRVDPFRLADTDMDGVVTMADLENLSLNSSLLFGDGYRLPNSSRGTFADYVRVLFRFAITFRTDSGVCIGNEPGTDEGGQPPVSP